jgi:hypothetical protein
MTLHTDAEDSHNGTKTRSEWTMVKEIVGTFVGISPFVIALVIWGSSVNERIRVAETRIEHLEAMDRRHEVDAAEQRREILLRLDRVGVQIEALQQLVASRGAGVVIRPYADDPPSKYRNSGSTR